MYYIKLFAGLKKIKFKVEKIQLVFLFELGIRLAKRENERGRWTYPSDTKGSIFMNHIDYLTPQASMFQISSQSVKPFNLEIGEHRDIESRNYIDFK